MRLLARKTAMWSNLKEESIVTTEKLDNKTKRAIKEGKKLMADPNSPKYSNMDDLKDALEI